jgi:hypothetical protein
LEGAGRMSKPLDQYVPVCGKCGERTFALCPLTMSEFIAENWRDRMNRVLPGMEMHCMNCGLRVKVGNLTFVRL